MKRLNYILRILTIIIVLSSYSTASKSARFYNIPTQTINQYELIGDNSKTTKQTINAFQISEFVTLKEYKNYLSSVKKDSSTEFYINQLPDSCIGSVDVYNKYLNSSAFDNFPVVGISWDNAMNFCKWKTINENKVNIQFIYRLPHCSEWLAAYSYLSKNKIKNDFNKNYSDWLINSKAESIFEVGLESPLKFKYDWVYLHENKDQKVAKRKLVIGNSYLYQQENILRYKFNFYSYKGYRQISFRYVKEKVSESYTAYHHKFEKNTAKSLLEHWGLKN